MSQTESGADPGITKKVASVYHQCEEGGVKGGGEMSMKSWL